MTILVVDPTGEYAANLRAVLEAAGHTITVTAALPPHSGADVVVIAGSTEIAANLCAVLRMRDDTLPILMLAGGEFVDAVTDRVAGLRAGADDSISVPFAPSQMVARIDALGRRARLVPKLPELLEADGCLFDFSRCVAVREGRATPLSPREVELVKWLHRHRERTVERREILEHVFHVSPEIETRSVDMAIATLRKKIEREPDRPSIIVSIKGLGYAWRAPN
ncbi:MAG: response regulator transcription factor [Kofleriaceae bacterium]